MKRCQTCQLEFPNSFSYCRNCGEYLISVTGGTGKIIYCAQCGAPAKTTWRHCNQCGSEIERLLVGPIAGEKEETPPEVARKPEAVPSSIEPTKLRKTGIKPDEWQQCPHCQAWLRRETAYCEVCGTAVGSASAPSSMEKGAPAPAPPVSAEEEPVEEELAEEEASAALRSRGRPTVEIPRPATIAIGSDAPPDGMMTTGRPVAARRSPLESIVLGESLPRRRSRQWFLPIALIILILVGGYFLAQVWWPELGRVDEPAGPTEQNQPSSLLPVSFRVVAVEQEDQFAGGHPHALVKLDEQALFMIRDEANYFSTLERGQAIADNLQQAVTNLKRDPQAEFRVEDRREGPTIVQVMPNLMGELPLVIVTILSQDVASFNRRSHEPITAGQLAEWWLGRLNDRVDLFAKGQPPTRTVEQEDGRALVDLHERARKQSPEAPLTRSGLTGAFLSLSSEQRQLLSYEGARTIPHREGH